MKRASERQSRRGCLLHAQKCGASFWKTRGVEIWVIATGEAQVSLQPEEQEQRTRSQRNTDQRSSLLGIRWRKWGSQREGPILVTQLRDAL